MPTIDQINAATRAHAANLQPRIRACMDEIDACIADPGKNPRAARVRAAAAFQRMVSLMAEASAVDLANITEGEPGSPFDMSDDIRYFGYLKSLDDHFSVLGKIIKSKLFTVGFTGTDDILEKVLRRMMAGIADLPDFPATTSFEVPGPATPQ